MIIPAVVPPLDQQNKWRSELKLAAAFDWLSAGWRDLWTNPIPSLSYGILVCLVSLAIIWSFVAFGWDYILFPALAGFMVVGPLIAIGLYEKSRRLAAGQRSGLAQMVFVRPAAGGQILFTGVLLCLLM